MKKLLFAILLSCTAFPLLSQTDGISYQAVILAPYAQELPGADVTDNILPNAPIAIRFTILDAQDVIEFQEEQFTQTDEFGRINLVIGSVNHDAFTEISWDGTVKNLLVEIDFESTGNYLELSKQELLFVPYAYHRNITATGSLKVDGPTELFSSLKVYNNTILERNLTVRERGTARFFGKVRIDSTATFYDNFTVDSAATATFLGPVNFVGPSTFNALNVNGETKMNGQVTIDYNAGDLGEDTIASYPLLVQGSDQGIAIKVNGNRSIDNNYISFWDEGTGQMWGRIEGITLDEQYADPEYIWERSFKQADIVTESVDAAIALAEWVQGGIEVTASFFSSTACAGVGACITAPIPSWITSSTVNLILKAANIISVGTKITSAVLQEYTFRDFKRDNIGVSYSSGAGDYAEWLPKQNQIDVFTAGELVGIKNGTVTKNIWDAEKVMIVSTKPIILGNMPQPSEEDNYVKIAFMGQVPVTVLGEVNPGDYILPSIVGSGLATAVSPADMNTRDYKKIAGVAWNIIEKISGEVSIVNVAVGIYANELCDIISHQEEEIKSLRNTTDQLEKKMIHSEAILAELLPGYAEAVGMEGGKKQVEIDHNHHGYEIDSHEETFGVVDKGEIVYFEIPRELIEQSMAVARQVFTDRSLFENQMHLFFPDMEPEVYNEVMKTLYTPIEDHPFWKKIDQDPAYREEIIQSLQVNLEKAFHTHQEYANNFPELMVRK